MNVSSCPSVLSLFRRCLHIVAMYLPCSCHFVLFYLCQSPSLLHMHAVRLHSASGCNYACLPVPCPVSRVVLYAATPTSVVLYLVPCPRTAAAPTSVLLYPVPCPVPGIFCLVLQYSFVYKGRASLCLSSVSSSLSSPRNNSLFF